MMGNGSDVIANQVSQCVRAIVSLHPVWPHVLWACGVRNTEWLLRLISTSSMAKSVIHSCLRFEK